MWWICRTWPNSRNICGMRLCPCSLPRCSTTAVAGGKPVTHYSFSLLWFSLSLDWWYFPASKACSHIILPSAYIFWYISRRQHGGDTVRSTYLYYHLLFQLLNCLQNHSHHFGALHGVIWTFCWILLFQRPADGAAGSSYLLGRLDLAHGL